MSLLGLGFRVLLRAPLQGTSHKASCGRPEDQPVWRLGILNTEKTQPNPEQLNSSHALDSQGAGDSSSKLRFSLREVGDSRTLMFLGRFRV